MGKFLGFACSHSLICNCNYATPTPTSIHPCSSRAQGHFPTWKENSSVCSCHRPELSSHRPPGQRGLCSPTKFPSLYVKNVLNSSSPCGFVSIGALTTKCISWHPPYRRPFCTWQSPPAAQQGSAPSLCHCPPQTPGPRPHPARATAPGRGRGRRGGSLPLRRCLLHAVAAAAPGGRWPSPQAPPDPHSSGQTSPPLNTEPTTSHGRAPAAATTATSGRGRGPPPAPLIGYSRATAGADWVLWTSLSAAAARKPRPLRAERALPRRREGKIMEAAVLPSSRHASRGDGPRGTPGGVVRPRGVPASRAGRTGAPAALFRPRASFPRSGRCAAGQGRPRAAPPPEGRYIPAATAGRPSRSPARVRQARQRHPAPPQKVEVLVGERLQSSAEGSSKSVSAARGSCSPQPPRVTRESFRGEKCRRWALGVWCQSTQVTLQGRGSCHVITQAAGFRLQSTMWQIAAISPPHNFDFLLFMYLNLMNPSRSSQANTRKAYMLKPISISFPDSRFICLTDGSSR